MKIGTHPIGPGHPCFIVAEAGINHNGELDLALRMVKAAQECGVDAIKFQAFDPMEFCTPNAEYKGKNQRDMFELYELWGKAWPRIKEACDAHGIIFFATPTDREAVDMLLHLDVPCFKVGSDDIVHDPLLEYIAATGRPMILSTGMAADEEIRGALRIVRGARPHASWTGALRRGWMPATDEYDDEIALLHCVSLYPTPPEQANLKRICALREHQAPVGYSDHTDGIEAAAAAVAMGACIIEKHFTLDKTLPGPDQAFSADPMEMLTLVQKCRQVHTLLGAGKSELSAEEMEMRIPARRSIRMAWDAAAGTMLAPAHLAYKRPGDGLPPTEAHKFIGKRLVRDRARDECLGLEDVG
jgi:N-acetylneuraminate synthase/N,N'-diacetyllegionaminate synthase